MTRKTQRPSRKAAGKQAVRKPRLARRPQSKPNRRPILGPMGQIAGSAVGGYFGGPSGAIIGGVAGSAAGRALSVLTGVGDYRVKSNVFATGQGIPSIRNAHKPGAVTIRHKEYLGDIVSSSVAGQFKIASYSINPALLNSFPWLSQIAQNYDEYEFDGLAYEFRSMSADALNSVNTALGTVIMATSYNVLNPNFASKAEMDAYEFSNSCRPSETMLHLIECAPQQNVLSELYTRAGAVPSGGDARFYDLGNFQIATSGMQGTNVVLGELWVTYQAAFFKPKMFSALGLSDSYCRFSGITYTNVNPLQGMTIDPNSTLALTVTLGGTVTFPPLAVAQVYSILFTWSGTVAAVVVPPTITLGAGITQSNQVYAAGGIVQNAPPSGSTSTLFSMETVIGVAASGLPSTVTLGIAGTLPTGTLSNELRVYQTTTVL